MSRTRRHRKRQGFKKRNVNCSTNVDKENQVEQLPMYDTEYTAPVSMSECLAMFLFIILLFIGCAYLILR